MLYEVITLIFTGYQVEETAGRHLLETGKIEVGEFDVEPKFEIASYQFSAHGERDELRRIVKKANPETLVIQHGEEEVVKMFKDWAVSEGFNENKVFTRITSYNVCYTKLLRIGDDAVIATRYGKSVRSLLCFRTKSSSVEYSIFTCKA